LLWINRLCKYYKRALFLGRVMFTFTGMKDKKITAATKKLIKARRDLGMSVPEFADLLGYSKESIYKKESGEVTTTKRDLVLINAHTTAA